MCFLTHKIFIVMFLLLTCELTCQLSLILVHPLLLHPQALAQESMDVFLSTSSLIETVYKVSILETVGYSTCVKYV